jgi:hypothetical protein
MHPLSLSAIYDTELLTFLGCVFLLRITFIWLIIQLLRRTLWIPPASGLFTRCYLTDSSPDRHQPIKKPDCFFGRASSDVLHTQRLGEVLLSPVFLSPFVCLL